MRPITSGNYTLIKFLLHLSIHNYTIFLVIKKSGQVGVALLTVVQ